MLRSLALLVAFAAVLAPAADVSGKWTFNVQTDQGGGNPTFVFKQDGEKLTGTYSGLFGKADLNGTVKGDTIDFHFKVDAQGENVEVRYSGTIESEKRMKGKVDFAGLGSGTWTGEKQ